MGGLLDYWIFGGRFGRLCPSRSNGPGSAFPVKCPFFESVEVADEQDRQERNHGAENQARVLLKHGLVNHRPRIKENHFDIEEDKQHRYQVELYRTPGAA